MGEGTFKQVRKMILIRVLLVPFFIVLVVCGTLVYHFAAYLIKQVKAELVRTAVDHRNMIDQFLEEKVADLRFISSSYSIDELQDKEKLARIFYHLQIGSKAFFDLGVFDERGRHLAYVGPYDLAGKDYAQAEWFKAVQERELFISDEFLGYRNIPHFIMAIRRNENGRVWYLRATIDTFAFNDLVESIRIGKTGEAYLVNKEGIFQSRRRSGGRMMGLDPDFEDYVINDQDIASFSARDNSSQRYLYAAGPLKHTEWIMVVRQAADDAYGTLTFAVIISLVMIIAGGIVVLGMGYIQASSMATKLKLADIEKQQMKTQLVIAGKLAEVGEMSTGLAHEINNPLQVMQSELGMVEEVISEIRSNKNVCDAENLRLLTDSAKQIGLQIERCGKITQGLLRFARRTDSSARPVEIQKFLPEVVAMVDQRALVENIRIIQELDPDLPVIMTDPNQLQQVFLNLLNNAIYALKDKNSGEIRIHCSREDESILITVADNGCGISPENLEKIFLPFFTTKPVGQGTGLGMSTVYGIVDGLGGKITVESELNVGTVFTIRLPIKAP